MAFAKDPYLRTLEERQKARRDAREADYLRSLHRDPPGSAALDERTLQARWDAHVPVTRPVPAGRGCTDEPMPCRGLEDLESFISKYLICSADQLTLLALWILHTYCYDRFRVTPYLEIRSRESESGKSTCLKILD